VSQFQNIRAVALDAVGTLIHPDPPAAIVYAEIGREFGSRLSMPVIADRFSAAFKQEEDWDRRHGNQTSEVREIERWRRIVAGVLDDVENPEVCFQKVFEHFARPQSWACNPEAEEVLEHLAAHDYRLGIASNYDHRLRSVVAGTPPLRWLQRHVISSEVGWRKPAPEFFAALCKALDARPEQVLYVGDDPINDFAGASAAGLKALLFDPGKRVNIPGTQQIESLKDVVELLR